MWKYTDNKQKESFLQELHLKLKYGEMIIQITKTFQFFLKITWKMSKNRDFSDIRYSATLAEYSVPNIRPILTEYSAEYSVFGRSLMMMKVTNI